MMAGVKLLSFWGSPFALRVRWALKLKGLEYEYIEEDLANKSALLLQYNPVYKKIPVLVHGERAIAESLVIIEYIDEVWRHNPLLPEEPYERALARFWAKFAEEKCFPPMFAAYASVGQDQAKAMKDLEENLKTFQGALKGRKFFGGETIGLVDIVAGWFAYWLPLIEEVLGIKLVDSSLTALEAWFAAILELEIVKELLPPKDKLLMHLKYFRSQLLGSSV